MNILLPNWNAQYKRICVVLFCILHLLYRCSLYKRQWSSYAYICIMHVCLFVYIHILHVWVYNVRVCTSILLTQNYRSALFNASLRCIYHISNLTHFSFIWIVPANMITSYKHTNTQPQIKTMYEYTFISVLYIFKYLQFRIKTNIASNK